MCLTLQFRNYEAELFAFGSRLKERFNMDTLRKAFLFKSHLEQDRAQRANLSEHQESDTVIAEHNQDFIDTGKKWRIDEETENKKIQNTDFPPKDETLTDSFFAVVGGINHDSGCQRAERFVQDFLLTKLYGKDINEIFNVREPELLLMAVLKSRGESAPEPRLLRQSGSFTVTPIYVVGFYVEKQLLGQSAGESVSIARKMAAREKSRSPYVFDRDHNLDDLKNRTNYRFSSEISDNEASLLLDLVNSVENEPLTPDLLNTTFKNVIEPTFGVVLRRRLKHYFYKGTPHRKVKRNFIQPKPETI
uniref:Large ribosomal subunit protein mL44 n=1 Tax=Romanomermis culicivorax TaxID=13658 RepID=A0A915K1F8_ROMCU